MPNNVQPVSFFGPQALGAALAPDAYQKQLQLGQQQQLAQGLMGEGLQPLDPNRMANPGGFVVPISPLEGLAHSGKAVAAALMQKSINKQQADLAQQQQQAFARLFSGQTQGPSAAGGSAVPTPQMGMSDNSANAVGAPWAAASGLPQQPQQPMPQQAPMQSSGPLSMPGMDSQRAQLAFMMNPQSYMAAYMKQFEPTELQKNVESFAPGSDLGRRTLEKGAFIPPIAQRANAPLVDAQTGRIISQPVPVPQAGHQVTVGPGGPVDQPLPGYQQTASQLSGTPIINAPMQTIKLSNQRELSLTQPEYLQYVKSGGSVLPSRYQALSNEIPGMRFQDAPTSPNQPVQTPPQPIPGKVPPEDMPAFNAVAEASMRGQPLTVSGNAPMPRSERAVVGATQSQGEQVQQARQTAAGKAVDEQFAKDYVAFTTGGASDAAKQLGQLQDVVKQLEDPKANLTGPILGHVPDSVKGFTNPNAVAMRERVEEVVQRSLRAILGAQFTEREGERLIARAYNPNLPESENAIRVNRLFTQLHQAFDAKQSAAQYFEKNGTLDGWRGKLPSISDFEPDAKSVGGKIKQPDPQQIVDELRRRGVVR